MTRLRVQFAHGLEGSPQGRKARFLAEQFDTRTPEMDTRDFPACQRLHAATAAEFRPDALVGSSFGGAVAVALLQSGQWAGPTLLLAPAVRELGLQPVLPVHVPIWIVHGTRDDVVDIEESRALARSGTAELVRLIEVSDDHRLDSLVETGKLADLVCRITGR